MEFGVTLSKMQTYYKNEVQYLLKADNDFLKMNALVGKKLKIDFLNQKFCSGCGNAFTDLFRMGFCRNCFFTNPRAGESIIRPELSQAHLGKEDRDLEYEKSYQLQPHVVYLANSAGLKVGVTRAQQKLQRWMDQGASYALVFAQTENRYQAGQIEVALKEFVGDKTPWQRMLKNEIPEVDLPAEKENLAQHLGQELQPFVTADYQTTAIEYPVKVYPAKVKSLNLDKEPTFAAELKGIKGQYLIFEGGRVLNIRGNTGYRVNLSVA
jgi:hypothetical protein